MGMRMADYIEGKRPVLEALRSGMPIQEVCIADNLERDTLVKDILRKCKQRNVTVKDVPRKRIEAMVRASASKASDDRQRKIADQGIVAVAAPFPYASLEDVIVTSDEQFQRHGRALVVLCDHLTDTGNLGAIARSAECVGAAGIVIPNKRSAHVTAATYKSSAGAVSHINVAEVANIAQAIDRLKEAGFWVVAATEHAHPLLWETNMKGRIALVLGNEQKGVSDLVRKCSDLECRLPMFGELSSLNVAQASTAFMYEWLRQNREQR